MKKMGAKVKYVRELRNLTLAMLSERCGLSSAYLSDIENNKKNPSTKSLEKIARALDADTWFFLDDNAVTFEKLMDVTKVDLPDDLIEFIADQKKLPFLVLAKQLDEEGVTEEALIHILQLAKSMKK